MKLEPTVRWITSLILIATFLALGSGLLERLHNLDHARQDAENAALAKSAGRPVETPPVHDDSNCAIHAQLHIPILPVAWVPLLVLLGIFVAFLSEIAHPLVSYHPLLRLDCRGPPAC